MALFKTAPWANIPNWPDCQIKFESEPLPVNKPFSGFIFLKFLLLISLTSLNEWKREKELEEEEGGGGKFMSLRLYEPQGEIKKKKKFPCNKHHHQFSPLFNKSQNLIERTANVQFCCSHFKSCARFNFFEWNSRVPVRIINCLNLWKAFERMNIRLILIDAKKANDTLYQLYFLLAA